MRYTVYFKSSKTACPKCGGLVHVLNSDDIILNCIDCGVYLKAIDNGQAEAELEFEEVEVVYHQEKEIQSYE